MMKELVLSETSITFSGQLLEYCRRRNIEILALSHNRRIDSLSDGPLHVVNRPRRFMGRGGIWYHLSCVAYGLYLATRARRFDANLAIIDSGSAHYFALASFRLLGIPVVINFHNTLWPNGFKPKGRLAKLISAFDGWFFQHIAAGALGCSPECGWEVRQVAGLSLPFFEYRNQFRREGFQGAPGKEHDRNRFVPFFAFAPGIRKMIYTTNAVEALHRSLRKIIKTRGSFPNDDAALKLLYLAVRNTGLRWRRAVEWTPAMGQFAIQFGERFRGTVR